MVILVFLVASLMIAQLAIRHGVSGGWVERGVAAVLTGANVPCIFFCAYEIWAAAHGPTGVPREFDGGYAVSITIWFWLAALLPGGVVVLGAEACRSGRQVIVGCGHGLGAENSAEAPKLLSDGAVTLLVIGAVASATLLSSIKVVMDDYKFAAQRAQKDAINVHQ